MSEVITPVRIAVTPRWERVYPGGAERRVGWQLTFNERIVETADEPDELKRIARLFNFFLDALAEGGR